MFLKQKQTHEYGELVVARGKAAGDGQNGGRGEREIQVSGTYGISESWG